MDLINGEMRGLSNNMTVRFSPDRCAKAQYTDQISSKIAEPTEDTLCDL